MTITSPAGKPAVPHWRPILLWFGLLAPGAFYFALLASQTTNVPWRDDLYAVLPFLADWTDASGWMERWTLLFSQFNSHRIVATRLAILAVRVLPGEFNFITLQLLGWIGWLAVWATMIVISRNLRRHLVAALPVSLLLMQPQGFSNLLVGMQGVQNIGIILVAFVGCHWATRPGCPAYVSLSTIFIAPFISANGLALGPVILAMALVRRRSRLALLATACSALTALVYFCGYESSFAPFAPDEAILNALVMLGAPFSLLRLDQHAIWFGAACGLAVAGSLLQHRMWREEPALQGMLLFVLLSVGMAARGRVGWGADYMLQDRYRIYGLIAAGILACLHLPRWTAIPSRKWAVPLFICLALGFNLVSYLDSWASVSTAARWNEATAANRQLGVWFPQTGDEKWEQAVHNLQRTEAQGQYHLPRVLSPEALVMLKNLPAPTQPANGMLMVPDGSLCGFRVEPESQALRNLHPDFALLHTSNRSIWLPVQHPRATFREFLHHGIFRSERYHIILPASIRPEVPMTLALLRKASPNGVNIIGEVLLHLPPT